MWGQDPTPPSVPRDLVACAGDNQVTLTWRPPQNWGENEQTGYEIQEKSTEYTLDKVRDSIRTTDQGLSVTIPAGTFGQENYATNGQIETWRVRAKSRVFGTESTFLYSDWAEVTTTRIGLPGQPRQVTASRGVAKLNVSWQRPACGAPTTGYDLHYTSNATVAADATQTWDNDVTGWTILHSTSSGGAKTSYAITGLVMKNYRIRVRAKNANGVGPWSEIASATPRTTVRFTSTSATLDEGSMAESLEVRIIAGLPNAFGGTLAYDDSSSVNLSEDLASYPASYDFGTSSNPTAKATVEIESKDDAINERDEVFTITLVETPQLVPAEPSTMTVTVMDDDLPVAPKSFTATGGKRRFTATWIQPQGPVTGYQLAYQRGTPVLGDAIMEANIGDPAYGWTTVRCTVTETVCAADAAERRVRLSVDGLEHETRYAILVRATDGTGWSGWSEQGAVGTDKESDAPPANVKAVSKADGQLTVSWARIDLTCKYTHTVEIKHEDATSWGTAGTAVNTCNEATDNSYTYTSLSPGRYQVRVKGTLDSVDSAWSEPISAIVKGGVVVSFNISGSNADAQWKSERQVYEFTEGFTGGSLSLVLNKAATTDLSVTLEAVPGSCEALPCSRLYKNLPVTVTIPMGDTTVEVQEENSSFEEDHIPMDENLVDIPGSYKLRLKREANAAFALADTAEVKLVIRDGDVGTLSFRGFKRTVAEGLSFGARVVSSNEYGVPIAVKVTTRADKSCGDLNELPDDKIDSTTCLLVDPTVPLEASDTHFNPGKPPEETPDAEPNVDYAPQEITVTLAVGESEAVAEFKTIRDLLAEPDEFIVVELEVEEGDGVPKVEIGPDLYLAVIEDSFNWQITDATPNPVVEGETTTVTVTFSDTFTGQQGPPKVIHTWTETAEETDIGVPSGELTFPNGRKYTTFDITTAEDADQDDEIFRVRSGPGDHVWQTITILDNDKPPPACPGGQHKHDAHACHPTSQIHGGGGGNTVDTDGDGTPDDADTDDDNDGVLDGADACPLAYPIPAGYTDPDGDGCWTNPGGGGNPPTSCPSGQHKHAGASTCHPTSQSHGGGPPTGGGGGGGGRGVCDRVDLVVGNLEVEEPEEKTSIRVRLPYNEPPFDTSTIIRCAAVSIKYTTEDGSALSGKDYESSSGEIELLGAGGRTEGYGEAILEIPIVDDALYEQDEAFTLKLEVDPSDNRGWSRSNLPIVDGDGYPVTIHSDDPPSSYVPAEPQPAWEYVE
ncbi:MAG: fibronectin type III domain-containing protein [Candidatus Tectomicrobia bacterium]|nr:fibronectin type III domain-containing protein [Candidatus Tectomicrobia bacterium]